MARRTGERLALMGIDTAWELREADPKRIRRSFSVAMERIVWELRGQPAIQLDDMAAPKQQIMVSRSFGRMIGDPADLREAVRQHAARAGEKLRRQGSVSSSVMVFVRTNPFQLDQPQYRNRVVVPLEGSTDDTREIAQAAACGLEAIFLSGYRYQKAGVMLLDLKCRCQPSARPGRDATEQSRATMQPAADGYPGQAQPRDGSRCRQTGFTETS